MIDKKIPEDEYVQLDGLDRRLVECLMKDARAGYLDLARVLGVSRTTVQKHLTRLFASGAMRQVLMLDPTRAGAPQSILVGLDVPRRQAEACFHHLLGLPPVSRVSLNEGRFNILAVAVFRDPRELGDFVAGELKALPGVRNCEVFPVYQTGGKPGEAPDIRILDDLDRRLVTIMERDCRVSSAVLSRETGVSLNTVQRRLAALMKGQFMRILTVVTEGMPGWVRHAGFGVRVRRPYAHQVMELLAGYPEIRYLYYTAGRYDILGAVVCPGEQEIYEVVEEKIGGLAWVEGADVFLPRRTAYNNRWLSRGQV